MPKVKERYYYHSRATAEHTKSMYKIMGVKATVKQLDDKTYVLKVY